MTAPVQVDARGQDDPAGVDNPYWQTVRTIPADDIFSHWGGVWSPNGHRLDNGPRRHTMVTQYAWAITNPAAVTFVADACAGRGVIEIGAGTGYWAYQLTQRGANVIAYDQAPPDQEPNHWHKTDTWAPVATWHPVIRGGPEQAGLYPERVLFLCWPPYDDPMAADALAAYNGDTVIYVGEERWGCTGDERFHEALAAGWDEMAGHGLVQWSGLHDWVTVYGRRP